MKSIQQQKLIVNRVKVLLTQQEFTGNNQEELVEMLNGLTLINLGGIKINNACAIELAKALANNKTLEMIIISNDDIDYVGIAALAGALQVNNKLTTVVLTKEQTGDEEIQLVKTALEARNSPVPKFRVGKTDIEIKNRNHQQPQELMINDIKIYMEIMVNAVNYVPGSFGAAHQNQIKENFLVVLNSLEKKSVTFEEFLLLAQDFMLKNKDANVPELINLMSSFLILAIKQNANLQQLQNLFNTLPDRIKNDPQKMAQSLLNILALAIKKGASVDQLQNLFNAIPDNLKPTLVEAITRVINLLGVVVRQKNKVNKQLNLWFPIPDRLKNPFGVIGNSLIRMAAFFVRENLYAGQLQDLFNAIKEPIAQDPIAVENALLKVLLVITKQKAALENPPVISNNYSNLPENDILTLLVNAALQNATTEQMRNLFKHYPNDNEWKINKIRNAISLAVIKGANTNHLQNLFNVYWANNQNIVIYIASGALANAILHGATTDQLCNFFDAIPDSIKNDLGQMLITVASSLVESAVLENITPTQLQNLFDVILDSIAKYNPEQMANIVLNVFTVALQRQIDPIQIQNLFQAIPEHFKNISSMMKVVMINILASLSRHRVTPEQLQNLTSVFLRYLKNDEREMRLIVIKSIMLAEKHYHATKIQIAVLRGLNQKLFPTLQVETDAQIERRIKAEQELLEQNQTEKQEFLGKRADERRKIEHLKNDKVTLPKKETQEVNVSKPKNKSAIEEFCDQRMHSRTSKQSIFRDALPFSQEIKLFKLNCEKYPPSEHEKLILAQTLLSIFFSTQKTKNPAYFLKGTKFNFHHNIGLLEEIIVQWCAPIEPKDQEIEITKNLILLNLYVALADLFRNMANDQKYNVVQNVPKKRSKNYQKISFMGQELSDISPEDYQNHLLIMEQYGILIGKVGDCIGRLNHNIGGADFSQSNPLSWNYLDDYSRCAQEYQTTEEKFAIQWRTRDEINQEFQKQGQEHGYPKSKSEEISNAAKVNELQKSNNGWQSEKVKTIFVEINQIRGKIKPAEASVIEEEEETPISNVEPQLKPVVQEKKMPSVNKKINPNIAVLIDDLFAKVALPIEDPLAPEPMWYLFRKAQILFEEFNNDVEAEDAPNPLFLNSRELDVHEIVQFNIEMLEKLIQKKRVLGVQTKEEEMFVQDLKNFPELKSHDHLGVLIEEMKQNRRSSGSMPEQMGALRLKQKALEDPIRNRILELTIECLAQLGSYKNSQGKNFEKELSVFFEMAFESSKQTSDKNLEGVWKTLLTQVFQSPTSEEYAQINLKREGNQLIASLFENDDRLYLVQKDHFGFFIKDENSICRIAINPTNETQGILLKKISRQIPSKAIGQRPKSSDSNSENVAMVGLGTGMQH